MSEKSPSMTLFSKGLLEENPTLRQMLGLCPTLAITTLATNGLGMGIATTFVLVCSEIAISLLRNVIPDTVRLPAFITIIAGFVTIIMMVISAYLPDLNNALGIYLPLIVVNCIVLGRAEVFASKHPVKDATLDGLGMGIGFTMTLILMSSIREILGAGTFFSIPVLPPFIEPMLLFGTPPGGFIVLGVLIAASMALQTRRRRLRGMKDAKAESELQANCSACGACTAKGSERS